MPHTIVATGDEPALMLAVGARKDRAKRSLSAGATAVRHGAGVQRETGSPVEAYARFSEPRPGPAPEIF